MTDARFHHGGADDAPRNGPLSAITRCLSGAAYTVPGFADRVITELLLDGHRAVSPAVDYDLEPIVRHAFAARRLWLVQHAVVTAILLLAFVFLPGPAFGLVMAAIALAVVGRMIRGDLPGNWKVWLGGSLVLLVLTFFSGPLLSALEQAGGSAVETVETTEAGVSPLGQIAIAALIGAAALIVTSAVRTVMVRALSIDLRPGHSDRGATVASVRIEDRIARLSAAQRGNILLHSGKNPFLGAGGVLNAWSMAMELKPDEDGDDRPDRPRRAVEVDPVALNRYVKQRLASLRSTDLREAERMSGLTLRDQVVSAGVGGQGWPLVDTDALVPYSHATPQAMESVIRSPQASVRHFLRATVGANVTPVESGDGRLLIPGEHHSISVSTFIHLAVEGGMLYVETVSTVLGPLLARFRLIDAYPADTDLASGRALRESCIDLGENIALAPYRLAVTLGRMHALRRAMRAAEDGDQGDLTDFGARFDLRQETSARGPVTYLQRLDAAKYTKLVERRISEAVICYLREHGIDTSEYERRMNVYNNSGVFIRGDNYGAAAGGPEASAVMQRDDDRADRPKKEKD
ncbi:hypothetical protein [Catenuloplanes japonicus]|uniref:hypothetical protein n=1 Tax=Catenuloplanes japonicus TaxID=33876 RepID=UPI000A88B29E|nr:hypothetical protein [Catenuloplanes japonicus]